MCLEPFQLASLCWKPSPGRNGGTGGTAQHGAQTGMMAPAPAAEEQTGKVPKNKGQEQGLIPRDPTAGARTKTSLLAWRQILDGMSP